eukprot:Blabericola_migrator_1__4032@NODE_2226_length_3096_cov_10_601519_g1402_i0_p2_GENE_NODE_2226_length_3096_cov_10_601519_g1402_i0NODE_2226_length_3096_cov_10_601519_g1402_i0_p2_ORF_typecomplete_len187_score18_55_NODE_2226_length_3096_cov_10_601519_g1402_i0122682
MLAALAGCPPEVSEMSLTYSKEGVRPSYILGTQLPDLGDQTTIIVDGVIYGLYKETPAGLKPAVDGLPSRDTNKLPPTETTTFDFTFPTYPSVELSASTAMAPVTSSEFHYAWETVITLGGVATALAVAFYMAHENKRLQTPTRTLIDQYTNNADTSNPLGNLRIVLRSIRRLQQYVLRAQCALLE